MALLYVHGGGLEASQAEMRLQEVYVGLRDGCPVPR